MLLGVLRQPEKLPFVAGIRQLQTGNKTNNNYNNNCKLESIVATAPIYRIRYTHKVVECVAKKIKRYQIRVTVSRCGALHIS